MVDDDSKLTRRRVLGGLATVGAAGAIGGAGTWAAFSDEERSNNYVRAGTLDLKIDGQNGTGVQTLTAGPVGPNDTGSDTSILENSGDIDGTLSAEVEVFDSKEGNTSEAETDTDPNNGGELEKYLNVTVSLDGQQVLNGNVEDLDGNNTQGGGVPLAAGDTADLDVSYTVTDAMNDAQGDEIFFAVKVYLDS